MAFKFTKERLNTLEKSFVVELFSKLQEQNDKLSNEIQDLNSRRGYMWITNLTGNEIICLVDKKKHVIHQEEMLDVSEFKNIRICHKDVSYSTDGVGNSKLLKILKVTDDPFNLSKEYHIVIDLEVTKSQIDSSKQMVISSATEYVDYDIKTYYDYFKLQCDGQFISPKQIFLTEIDTLKLEFIKNTKKLKWWRIVTDGLIEPLVFDAFGLFLSCTLLSRFVGNYVWFLFVPVIVVQLISILIMIFKPTAKKQIQKFIGYLKEESVRGMCYLQNKGPSKEAETFIHKAETKRKASEKLD